MTRFTLAATAGLLALPGSAQDRPSPIWGAVVMPQPFDTRPFRAVPAAARHGVTISELNSVDPFYPYYDSRS